MWCCSRPSRRRSAAMRTSVRWSVHQSPDAATAATQLIIGPFMNTLPLRIDLGESGAGADLPALVRDVRTQVLGRCRIRMPHGNTCAKH